MQNDFIDGALGTPEAQAIVEPVTEFIKKLVDGVLVKGNNGFFISYGPYDSPKLAVAVVVENVDSGSATADVAAEIYKYWFSRTDSVPPAQAVGVVLE